MQLAVEVTRRTLSIRVGRSKELWLELGKWAGWRPCANRVTGGSEFSWLWIQGATSR